VVTDGPSTAGGGRAAEIALGAASAASLVLFPLLLMQGMRVRRVTPRLPEAGGPREGRIAGAEPTVRLLVVGESTAAGVGAADHGEALAGQVARALAERAERAVDWRVLGRNGATADAARRDLVLPAESLRADVAVLALGVNDTLRFHSPARWRRDLAALAEAVRERCGPVPILLSSVPPVGRFPALPQPLRGALGIRAALLDRAARRLANELADARHVPMPALERDVAAYFCADRFHPSPAGYAAWGAAVAEAAADVLARRESQPPVPMIRGST
jgi:lysophospholipase L1-like esterase